MKNIHNLSMPDQLDHHKRARLWYMRAVRHGGLSNVNNHDCLTITRGLAMKHDKCFCLGCKVVERIEALRAEYEGKLTDETSKELLELARELVRC